MFKISFYIHIILSIYLSTCIAQLKLSYTEQKTQSPLAFDQKDRGKALREGPVSETPTVETTKQREMSSCVCSKIYDPVCASNKKSYYNLCLLHCDVGADGNVTVVHQGNCIPF